MCLMRKSQKNTYMLLYKSIKQVPAHNFLMVMGDFNARVGKEHYKFPYHDSTNRNGELLHTLAIENELEIANVSFCKKKSRLWTCTLPSGFKAQLDYILVCRKWRNSILNCCTYNSFASIGSDHRVVTAKLRLSLRSNGKTPPRKIRYNWKVLAQDTQLQDMYAVKVRNIIQCSAT
ncbi:craniofacial development protein 2-like [Amphiura filiformis]|uniref:craniofacial development protein 2-like n=1 Tax=Amphiura filiformis TaxID=82378 RepID=UPI003B20F331